MNKVVKITCVRHSHAVMWVVMNATTSVHLRMPVLLKLVSAVPKGIVAEFRLQNLYEIASTDVGRSGTAVKWIAIETQTTFLLPTRSLRPKIGRSYRIIG